MLSKLSVFVSYSVKDKELAGHIKKCLEEYFGLQIFLAHNDISPATEWEPEIVEKLRTTDLFVILLSKNSLNSVFVNQEIGMALAWKKKIIPVSLDNTTNPFGFINKIQACKTELNSSGEIDITETCLTIFFIFATHKNFSYARFQKRSVDCVVSALSTSASYPTSIAIAKILEKLSLQRVFTKKQISEIKKISKTNDQVYGSFIAAPLVEGTIKKQENSIDIR
jgi:hypothetical protein